MSNGDFPLANAAKGLAEPANDSKPVRFAVNEPKSDEDENIAGGVSGGPFAFAADGVLRNGDGDGDGDFRNTFSPFTDAKGDVADAYAINPPYGFYQVSVNCRDAVMTPTFLGAATGSSTGGGVGRLVTRGLESLSESSLGRFEASFEGENGDCIDAYAKNPV